MATNSTYNSPPPLTKSKNYEDWTKLIAIWRKLTVLGTDKQGPAVALVLEGDAQQAILELTTAELATGVCS